MIRIMREADLTKRKEQEMAQVLAELAVEEMRLHR